MHARPPASSAPRDWIDWPFFEVSHRELATRLDCFVDSAAVRDINHDAVDEACRKLVRALGEAGLLEAAVPSPDGDASGIDSRAVCLARETLARRDGLADFAFAMQGLGSGAVAIAGSAKLRAAILPKARSGEWLAAFALSEKDAGSDVAAMACSAREDGDDYIIDGEKTWISNGGIADFYTLFARTGEAPGARGISAFVIFPDDPGFSISERIDVIAPHPLATLRFEACRIPKGRRVGAPGSGFKIAMQTLDIFRASVAAAALAPSLRRLPCCWLRAVPGSSARQFPTVYRRRRATSCPWSTPTPGSACRSITRLGCATGPCARHPDQRTGGLRLRGAGGRGGEPRLPSCLDDAGRDRHGRESPRHLPWGHHRAQRRRQSADPRGAPRRHERQPRDHRQRTVAGR